MSADEERVVVADRGPAPGVCWADVTRVVSLIETEDVDLTWRSWDSNRPWPAVCAAETPVFIACAGDEGFRVDCDKVAADELVSAASTSETWETADSISFPGSALIDCVIGA